MEVHPDIDAVITRAKRPISPRAASPGPFQTSLGDDQPPEKGRTVGVAKFAVGSFGDTSWLRFVLDGQNQVSLAGAGVADVLRLSYLMMAIDAKSGATDVNISIL